MRFLNFLKKPSCPYSTLTLNPPLVDLSNKIALFWTPKTGCTFTTKWFFSQIGVLEEALNYHDFVHRYRIEVYQKSKAHQLSVKKFLKASNEFTVIKVVRNPILRAVSSYIHAIKYGFINNEMTAFLGREIDQNNGFSFDEFITYVETLDIHRCNPHLKAQVHLLERDNRVSPDHVINLPDATKELERLEKALNLTSTNPSILVGSNHHTIRKPGESFAGDKVFNAAEHSTFPESTSFYNEVLTARVGKIYQEDISRYSNVWRKCEP